MKTLVLLALPIIFLGTSAFGQSCQSDPRGTSCPPGQWIDLSNPRGAQCHACTGDSISNGCAQSCSTCGAGKVANSSHTACVTPPPCPTISGSQIPTRNWSAQSSQSGYYALDSAIVNVGNGQVVVGSAPRSTVKSYMGGAFSGATFTVVGGAAPGPASGVITCPYDGPRFQNGGRTLEATVTINCTGTCAGL